MKTLYTFWLCAIASVSFAQVHQPLKSRGPIPQDFLELSSAKFEIESASLDSVDKRSRRKAKKEFYLQSNYILDDLLRSGKVMFNDRVSTYINDIVDTLLAHDPAFRKTIRIYTVKSPYVNAFATNSGLIFINMGLLAQAENEAQLAYILSHEIIHYKKKHAINSYVESQEIAKAARTLQISFNDALLARSNYSQDLEMEADEEGLELYLKSPYDPAAVEDVFFLLEFSHLPYDEVAYKRSFLELPHVKLSEDHYLSDVKEIHSLDEYHTEFSTHPNCQERRSRLVPLLRTASSEGKKINVLGKDRFKELRQIARQEMTRYYLNERQYGAALYNTFLMLDEDSNSYFAQKAYLKSLNYLIKYKNRSMSSDVLRSHYNIQGESQQLHHLLKEISAEDLNTLALAKAWHIHERFPNDQEISRLINELMYELTFYHNNDFTKYRKLPSPEDTISTPEPNEAELSKYDKIKKKIGREDYENDSTNTLYAFHDHLDDSGFVNRFMRMARLAESAKDSATDESVDWQKKLKKRQQEFEKSGLNLGIDKVLMLDPKYYKVKTGLNNELLYQKTEERQLAFMREIEKMARKTDVEVAFLSPFKMEKHETVKFNHFAVLQEWIDERYAHQNIDRITPSNTECVDSLIDVYGTRYVAVARVVNVHDKNPMRYLYACICCAGVYTSPIAAYLLLKRDLTTQIKFDVIDLKTGEIVMEIQDEMKSKDHRYLIRSKLYHIFNQIN